ncbi:MAG: S8 family serine peptidase [Gemmatimonadota bacterium]|nr:S8 family serine peptidase [Gemmatimonadota bacterium]
MTSRHPSAILMAGLLTFAVGCSDRNSSPLETEIPGTSADGLAPLHPAPSNGVPGSYIVVLKSGSDPQKVASASGVTATHLYEAAIALTSTTPGGPNLSRSASGAGGAGASSGFAAALSEEDLLKVRRDPGVAYVEQDQVLQLAAVQYMDSYGDPWGMDRTDQRTLSLSKSYTYTATGSGVNVYVVDTGIQSSHSQFEGRARNVYDAFGGSGEDCHGHGSSVAGTIGGKTYGVAKKVNVLGVRVMDCNAYGTASQVIAALDWIRKNRANPAVVNMSLAGEYSSALNGAVENLVASGVFVAVGAGNAGGDACKYSPASAASAYTVAATDASDYRASYSNTGSCVDGYAPGSKIWTVKRGGDAHYMTGTSMASPHIAAAAALYLGANPAASPGAVDKWLKDNATSGVVKNNPSGTPNRLLFVGSLSSTSSETTLSSGWSSRDIGAVGVAGSTLNSGSSFAVSGSGADIWGSADAFHYAYRSLSGDGELIARVASQTNTSQWAKSGIMIRESLNANSKNAMVAVTPSNGVTLQYRTSTGGSSGYKRGGSGSAPVWLRLKRSGSTITASRSADGSSWSTIGSVSISMNSTVYIGLATTSTNNTTLSTAKFESVR